MSNNFGVAAVVVSIIGLVARDRKYGSDEYSALYWSTIVFCCLTLLFGRTGNDMSSSMYMRWMSSTLILTALILGSVLLNFCMPEKQV